MSWEFIQDGLCEGEANMAADRALLKAMESAPTSPVLRLYGWSRPTLSVGYSQNELPDVDRELCQKFKVPIVQRPTGGQAVLHDRELTYCVVAPIPHPQFPSQLRGAYERVALALLAGLKELGVDGASMAKNRPKHDKLGAANRSPICFANAGYFEIVWNGKKMIGSAQKRTRRAFLQHGSIPLELNREFMNSLFVEGNGLSSRQALERLNNSTVSLSEALGEKVDFQEAALGFKEGFENFFKPTSKRAMVGLERNT